MSAPKASHILLILAVVALVVLFLVGVGVGASGGRPSLSPEERTALRDRWLGKPDPVAVADLVSEGCGGSAKRPAIAAACQLRIRPSRAVLRSLVVRSRDKLHLVFTPNGGPRVPIDVKLQLNRDNEVELSVDKDGAVLALTCEQAAAAPQPCVAVLE